jgi:hypothetical protein
MRSSARVSSEHRSKSSRLKGLRTRRLEKLGRELDREKGKRADAEEPLDKIRRQWVGVGEL